MRFSVLAMAVAVVMVSTNAMATCYDGSTYTFGNCTDQYGSQYSLHGFGNPTDASGFNPYGENPYNSNSYTGNQWSQQSQVFGNGHLIFSVQTGRNSWSGPQFGGFGSGNGTNAQGQPYPGNCAPYNDCK
jgi:hypothetical protein